MQKEREKSPKRNRYEKIKKMGEGAYGSVTKVFDHEAKCMRALKKIRFTNEDEGAPVHAIREISFLKKILHPNIIQIIDVHYSWEHSKMYMSLEFVEETLFEHLKKNFPLSPYAIKSYSFQILKAIQYIHSHGIMHRDLKLQNLLVTEAGQIKLCDFGQAKFTAIQNGEHSSEVATLWYRAPQILLGSSEYFLEVDIWSVGCIIAEMVIGEPLFKSNSEIGQIFQIFKSRGTPTKEQFPKWSHLSSQFPIFKPSSLNVRGLNSPDVQCLNELLEQMLELCPKKRVGASKALKHGYFDGYS